MDDQQSKKNYIQYFSPFLAGACAGLAVDITLFPIDTVKTRLQSPQGFWQAGGFSRIYSGIGSTIAGSAPGAALFFVTYQSGKRVLSTSFQMDSNGPFCSMISATCGEIVACLVRVPVEVVKQRAQSFGHSSLNVCRQTIAQNGLLGLYRGYGSTLLREIPFSVIQFPLWEFTKHLVVKWQQNDTVQPYQSMLCGSFAGGISAFLTTPLDVLKTQIILQGFQNSNVELKNSLQIKPLTIFGNYGQIMKNVYQRKGLRGFWAGAIPRVMWISIGGAIFLGGFDFFSQTFDHLMS